MKMQLLAEKIDGMRLIIGRMTERTDAKGLRDFAIIRLLFDMGLKRGMIIRLDLSHVNLETGSIEIIEKGSQGQAKTRTLPEPTIQALRGWIAIRGNEPGPLFNSIGRGRPGKTIRLTANTISAIIRCAGKVVGIASAVNGKNTGNRKRNGHGIRGKSPSVTAFEQLYRLYGIQARRRNIAFELNASDFGELTKQDCHYCGNPPSNIKDGIYKYSGIDRTDSNKGYTIDNCVPCCKRCNWMKLDSSEDEFLAQTEKIHAHQRDRKKREGKSA